jgi:hypothetical protein
LSHPVDDEFEIRICIRFEPDGRLIFQKKKREKKNAKRVLSVEFESTTFSEFGF